VEEMCTVEVTPTSVTVINRMGQPIVSFDRDQIMAIDKDNATLQLSTGKAKMYSIVVRTRDFSKHYVFLPSKDSTPPSATGNILPGLLRAAVCIAFKLGSLCVCRSDFTGPTSYAT
jgi:hypothetical protein